MRMRTWIWQISECMGRLSQFIETSIQKVDDIHTHQVGQGWAIHRTLPGELPCLTHHLGLALPPRSILNQFTYALTLLNQCIIDVAANKGSGAGIQKQKDEIRIQSINRKTLDYTTNKHNHYYHNYYHFSPWPWPLLLLTTFYWFGLGWILIQVTGMNWRKLIISLTLDNLPHYLTC